MLTLFFIKLNEEIHTLLFIKLNLEILTLSLLN